MNRARCATADDGQYILFRCPGCDDNHQIVWQSPESSPRECWTWNGSLELPTFTPSVLVRYGIVRGIDRRCHSYVTDGRIQYLGDSTHALAGQTVDLPPWWTASESVKALTLRLPADLYEQLKIVAEVQHVPIAEVVREAIQKRLEGEGES